MFERIYKEIVDTEESYLNSMKTLLAEYDKADIDQIPPKISQHFELIREMVTEGDKFLDLIKKEGKNPGPSIETLTNDMKSQELCNFLKKMLQYASTYEDFLEDMKVYVQQSKPQWVKDLENNPSQQLYASYLIQPIQRPPRWRLFLDQIKKLPDLTPELSTHFDGTYEFLLQLVSTINEEARLQQQVSVERKAITALKELTKNSADHPERQKALMELTKQLESAQSATEKLACLLAVAQNQDNPINQKSRFGRLKAGILRSKDDRTSTRRELDEIIINLVDPFPKNKKEEVLKCLRTSTLPEKFSHPNLIAENIQQELRNIHQVLSSSGMKLPLEQFTSEENCRYLFRDPQSHLINSYVFEAAVRDIIDKTNATISKLNEDLSKIPISFETRKQRSQYVELIGKLRGSKDALSELITWHNIKIAAPTEQVAKTVSTSKNDRFFHNEAETHQNDSEPENRPKPRL